MYIHCAIKNVLDNQKFYRYNKLDIKQREVLKMIGNMISKIRKEKGITKTRLAELTDINIGH